MNLGELRARLALLTGVTSNDTIVTAAALNGLINSAIHDIETEKDWWWDQTTTTIAAVSGTSAYAAPADLKRVDAVYIAGRQPIPYLTRDNYVTRFIGGSTATAPAGWSYWNGQLVFGPTPDSSFTITVDYYRLDGDLANDTDSPAMPARFHQAIVDKAVPLVLDAKGDDSPERRRRAEKSYDDAHRAMLREARLHKGFNSVRST